jgi:hypothetical protein
MFPGAPSSGAAQQHVRHLNVDHCLFAEVHVKPYRNLLFLILLGLAIPATVLAQPADESGAQQLEARMKELERRVAALEAQQRERKASAPVPTDKINWRQLKKGMTESEVEKLLGSPTRVQAFGSFTLWQYGGRGEVQFDGESRTVTGWHEP